MSSTPPARPRRRTRCDLAARFPRGPHFAGALLSLLAACPAPALRADEPQDVRPELQLAHNRDIWAISFSADGRFVISGSMDGRAIVRDANEGTCLRVLSPCAGHIMAVALSRHGESAAVGTQNGLVGLFDVAAGREVRRFRLPAAHAPLGRSDDSPWIDRHARLELLCFGSDGREIHVANGRQLTCWSVESGRLLRVLDLDPRGLDGVRISRGGSCVVAGFWRPKDEFSFDEEHEIRVFRSSDFARIAAFPVDDRSKLTLDASDAAGLVALQSDMRIALRDLNTGRIVASGPNIGLGAWPLETSADGKTLAVRGTILRVKDDRFETVGMLPDEPIRATIALSDDGRLIAAAQNDVGLWSVERGRWLWETRQRVHGQWEFAAARTRPVIHALLAGVRVSSWNIRDWPAPRVVEIEPGRKTKGLSLTCSADGREVLLSDSDGRVRRLAIDGNSRTPTYPPDGPQDLDVDEVVLDSSGTRRACVVGDRESTHQVVVVESASGRRIVLAPPLDASRVDAATFDPTGEWLAVVWSGTTWLYRSDRPQRVLQVSENDGRATCVAYDEARKVLVTGTSGSKLTVWDPTNGKRVRRIDVPGESPDLLALSDDAQTVAVGTEWGGLHLCDVATGRVRRTVPAHAGHIVGLGFESGRRLWTAGADGFVKVWTAEAMRELARIAFLADGGWIVQTPDGRFDGSPGCEKHVAYIETGTLRVRTDDGLAARFRRPGLLKQVLAEHDAMR